MQFTLWRGLDQWTEVHSILLAAFYSIHLPRFTPARVATPANRLHLCILQKSSRGAEKGFESYTALFHQYHHRIIVLWSQITQKVHWTTFKCVTYRLRRDTRAQRGPPVARVIPAQARLLFAEQNHEPPLSASCQAVAPPQLDPYNPSIQEYACVKPHPTNSPFCWRWFSHRGRNCRVRHRR